MSAQCYLESLGTEFQTELVNADNMSKLRNHSVSQIIHLYTFSFINFCNNSKELQSNLNNSPERRQMMRHCQITMKKVHQVHKAVNTRKKKTVNRNTEHVIYWLVSLLSARKSFSKIGYNFIRQRISYLGIRSSKLDLTTNFFCLNIHCQNSARFDIVC